MKRTGSIHKNSKGGASDPVGAVKRGIYELTLTDFDTTRPAPMKLKTSFCLNRAEFKELHKTYNPHNMIGLESMGKSP